MAYVLSPLLHPDQESILVTEFTLMDGAYITLLLEDGAWRIYTIGPPVPPADLGKVAYSW